MRHGLTYPSTKAVLQYLEPNKRIYIFSTSRFYRNIERSIPLHSNSIKIDKSFTSLNGFYYKPEYSWLLAVYLRINCNDLYTVHFQRGMSFQKAFDKILKRLLARRKIFAKNLSVKNLCSLKGIQETTFKIKTLDFNTEKLTLESFLTFIDPRSFPLKELKVNISRNDGEIQYWKLTNNLTISNEKSNPVVLEILKRHKLESIVLENIRLTREQLYDIIRIWTRDGRGIGTKVTLMNDTYPITDYRVPNSKRALWKDGCNVYACRSLPFTDDSELVIYRIQRQGKLKSIMEVMPIGRTTRDHELTRFDKIFCVAYFSLLGLYWFFPRQFHFLMTSISLVLSLMRKLFLIVMDYM